MSDENPEPEASADAKKKAKKSRGGGAVVAILFGLLNLGATGFLVFRDMKRPVPVVQIGGSVEHGDGGHDEKGPKRRKKKEGPVAQLDPFVVNLKDEGVSRYLKTSFELELEDPEALEELTAAKRAVRDDVLRYLSSLAVNDTLGEEAKQKIQDGIVARLDRQLGPERIKKLYFTEFVIQ